MLNIRNFVIIAHIDSGKSTLADRLLEFTGTIENRLMRPQYLDQLSLERERGITIKMAPVRMLWHSDRGLTQTETRTDADKELLFEDLTYKIRGAAFKVKRNLGLGHKEVIYQRALEEEFLKESLSFEKEKTVDLLYDKKEIGVYRPDFIVENKIIVELKALPSAGQTEEKQLWSYLKGSEYKVALLINFGSRDIEFKRVAFDTARQRESASSPRGSAQVVLNLIDTPGHSDFSYEVSRALAAVEGALLLVDATQGIQAQTLANYRHAKEAGLAVIGAVNKIDMNPPLKDKVIRNLAELLGVGVSEILQISAKTGEGIGRVLEDVIDKIPPPRKGEPEAKALIFDSIYDDHKGIIAYVRMFGGVVKQGDGLYFLSNKRKFTVKETGYFSPQFRASKEIRDGEIGYIATGVKEPDLVRIGDTITKDTRKEALRGYSEPNPVVFVSFYPQGETSFEDFREALGRLRLNDAALSFEPETNEILGRGFKVGFLGQLHFEITASRLEEEFGMRFSTSLPSVAFRVRVSGREFIVKQPSDFPDDPEEVFQPIIRMEIIAPPEYVSAVLNVVSLYDLSVMETKNMGDDVMLIGEMPLAELMRGFDNSIKSVSAGFASFSYELVREEKADVEKLEILVNGEVVPALSRIVPREDADREAKNTVERLKEALPRQQFNQALQGKAHGRIISRETIPALRKDVTGYLYGGDRTRKMKLWKKQQRGKKKLLGMGKVQISPEVIRQILKK